MGLFSNNRFNYKGLVCPRFSIYWTILSILFFYFIYPKLVLITTLTRSIPQTSVDNNFNQK
ncbi:MAG: hypothetical protein B6229_02465 [Spirochaetaceae bacterium 4572_7]|nr:MAG: hypothetical protein B6229_02465 [Spirochaetaceae bacterium 4572_7]